MTTNFVHNDGGRAQAGYKGNAGDCVVRAIAIATELPYSRVYEDLWELNRKNNKKRGEKTSPRDGSTRRKTIRTYLENMGWQWTPTMKIGSGCRVHLKANELPSGRLIVSVSKHLVTMIDGVIHDTYDPSREGTRCVYGYWTKQG